MTPAVATPRALAADLVAGGRLTGATFSKPNHRDALATRVTVRPVAVAGELLYAFTLHLGDRTTSENLAPAAAEERLVALLDEYRQALLHADDADYQVLGGERVLERPPTKPAVSLAHDRPKKRVLPEGEPVPFLVELGVMTRDGRVRARRYGKFRQVNRFLELVEDVLPALPTEGPLRVVDFGSGKSYLTFALHHLLRAVHGREVDVVGLDLKRDVVEACASLADRLGADGLRFETGDIAGFQAAGPIDLVVSLHACDTATDEALAQAVRWEASAILAVPCCQHELLRQIESRELAPLLAHGVLKERFAAEVTDASRAQLLGLAGYDVQLLEFVDLEHTAKNVLIRAVRRPGRRRARLAADYRAFRDGLGIEPALERLLRDRIDLGG
jgi:SAM-dependent methyltransferase